MDRPTTRAPEAAAKALREAIRDPRAPMTIADASAASGLPLRDAEVGLHRLVADYRGHLRVGEKGDLVFLFPHGFTQPWKTEDALERALRAVGRAAVGIGRFVVRAWLMIAMVAYALLFLALLVAVAFGGSRDERRDGGALAGLGAGFLRLFGDALFWTFHPFSPLYVDVPLRAARPRRARREPDVPFYEKVNRFVFGPAERPADPLATEERVVRQIRAGKGRVGLADVMRATGLPREAVDGMMARLMLDYEGTVEVSDAGGIYYVFEALRRSAREDDAAPPAPAWERRRGLPPLTGNGPGADIAIAMLNGFNGLMAAWALANHATLNNLPSLVLARAAPPGAHLPALVGVPIALGVVPLVMSGLVFLLPLGRWLLRGRRERALRRENARLAVLREVLGRTAARQPVTDRALSRAWRAETGEAPASKELTREVVALGGDVDLEASEKEGGVRYRFVDLETEAAAVEAEREQASDEEKRVGRIVFATD